MKKSFALFIVLFGFCLFAKAQVYLGAGGYPNGAAMSTDLTLEARGRPTASDKFYLGLRGQLAFADQAVYSSICITADYYLSRPENGFRIFAGAGLGGFNELNATNSNSFFDLNYFDLNNARFGFFPRIGIEAGRFRLSGEYNITGGINNYAAVNLGFFFGGDRKK